MIVVELATGESPTAILALEVVTGQNVDPGELHPLFAHRDGFLDPSYGWYPEGHGRGRDCSVVLFQYFDLALDKLANCVLPMNDTVGLHPGVEQ